MSGSITSRPPTGRINPYESSDYPIILGESLKHEGSSSLQYLRLRYNWEPKHGFANHKGNLMRSNNHIRLEFEDNKSEGSAYDYDAVKPRGEREESEKQMTKLALIFDAEKSAYVLEQISQSLDLNLVDAYDQTKAEVDAHEQISAFSDQRKPQTTGGKAVAEQDEDDADPSNPFDFRHFLSEAKVNAEKATQPTGSRTPIPGSRTPMSGISSPSLGAVGRFLPTNGPQFRPIPTSAPLPKKSNPTPKSAPAVTSKKQTTTKRKPPPSRPAVLSSEIVSDSSDDENVQDTITVSRPPTSQAKERGHNRNVSAASVGRSPNIVVTDGLEIDMGSPPHDPHRRPAFELDLDAFRSQTHTPTLPVSRNKPPATHLQRDVDMRDSSEDEDNDDDNNHDRGHEKDEDMDDDVEVFTLPSPRNEKKREIEVAPSPPTPSAPPQEDDEDEDFLAAELEAAMGGDDDSMEPRMNVVDDEESEVSEEE